MAKSTQGLLQRGAIDLVILGVMTGKKLEILGDGASWIETWAKGLSGFMVTCYAVKCFLGSRASRLHLPVVYYRVGVSPAWKCEKHTMQTGVLPHTGRRDACDPRDSKRLTA